MLKISENTKSITRPKKVRVKVGDDGKAERGGVNNSTTHLDA